MRGRRAYGRVAGVLCDAYNLNPTDKIQHMMDKYNINQTTLRILGLYAGDYERRLHIREISRETRVDVKAIQIQLKRLEENNILQSKTSGRNKEHSLNISNTLTRYYLILAETYTTATYLAEHYHIKRIVDEVGDNMQGPTILFGSYAKGEEDEQSDVDILTITDTQQRLDTQETSNLIGKEINAKNTTRDNFVEGLDEDPLIIEAASHHIVLRDIDQFTQLMWRHYARR